MFRRAVLVTALTLAWALPLTAVETERWRSALTASGVDLDLAAQQVFFHATNGGIERALLVQGDVLISLVYVAQEDGRAQTFAQQQLFASFLQYQPGYVPAEVHHPLLWILAAAYGTPNATARLQGRMPPGVMSQSSHGADFTVAAAWTTPTATGSVRAELPAAAQVWPVYLSYLMTRVQSTTAPRAIRERAGSALVLHQKRLTAAQRQAAIQALQDMPQLAVQILSAAP